MPHSLIQEYGYLAVLLITLVEGESIVILAGIAVGSGQLAFEAVVLCALLGGMAGDQFFFHAGRHWGTGLLARRASWAAASERIRTRLQTHAAFVMLTCRFWYGLRTAIPLLIGAARLSPVRFLALNFIGAATWATAYTLGGWLLGEALMRHFEAVTVWGVIAVAGATMATVAMVARLASARGARRPNADRETG